MSVGDLLSGIGRGVATAGRVAGAVLEPLGKRTAEVVSGEAPEIDRERRQHTMALSDEDRERKANELEAQLETGRKYGTLTPEQQKQYVDQISGLYSKPEHQDTLLKRIHKAIHPNGAVRQSAAPLPNAIPEGGELAQDEAQKLKSQAAEAEQQRQQQQKQTQDSWSFFSKFIPDEDKPKAQSEWAMKNLGIASASKNIPGAAGQPVKGQDGRYYRPMQQADGSIVQEPMPPDWTPAPKQGQPKIGTVDGKPAWGTLTPNGWVDPETQQRIPNFIPPPNYAQVAIPLADARARASAKYGIQEVTDENGNLVDTTRLDAANRAMSGNPYSGKEISAPTGIEKSRQDLANSSIMNIHTMKDIVRNNASMFGPGPGRVQDFANWVGSNSPDAQRFRTAALISSEHLAGVFGGRAVQTVDELKNTITSMHLTPEALLAGLDQAEKSAAGVGQAGGRLPTAGAKSVGKLLPKTGAQTISDDEFLMQVK